MKKVSKILIFSFIFGIEISTISLSFADAFYQIFDEDQNVGISGTIPSKESYEIKIYYPSEDETYLNSYSYFALEDSNSTIQDAFDGFKENFNVLYNKFKLNDVLYTLNDFTEEIDLNKVITSNMEVYSSYTSYLVKGNDEDEEYQTLEFFNEVDGYDISKEVSIESTSARTYIHVVGTSTYNEIINGNYDDFAQVQSGRYRISLNSSTMSVLYERIIGVKTNDIWKVDGAKLVVDIFQNYWSSGHGHNNVIRYTTPSKTVNGIDFYYVEPWRPCFSFARVDPNYINDSNSRWNEDCFYLYDGYRNNTLYSSTTYIYEPSTDLSNTSNSRWVSL